MSVTFHHPVFDSTIKDKIGNSIEVLGDAGHCVKNLARGFGCHAISSVGFPFKIDGTHVFISQVDEIKRASMCIGWTSTPTFDSSTYAYPRYRMSGCSFWLYKGKLSPGDVRSVPEEICKKAKEVVSILTIAENGNKITAQWIVDGTEGAAHDVSKEFEKGSDQMFPVVVLVGKDQQIQTIPFSQLKSTSPKIEEMKKKLTNHIPLPSSSSTNNEENDKLIAELRQKVEEGNRKLLEQKNEQLAEKDKEIENMKEVLRQQLVAKDQQYELALQQLELERAEHQKTRNLLHQSKQEMKDMEIHFLKERNKILMQKESGQRRGREEDEFQVKQERSD